MRGVITVDDAARRLKRDPSRVRALVKKGELEATRIGRAWLISEQSVVERLQRTPLTGRPYNPASAWAALFLAARQNPHWINPQVRSRLRRALRVEGLEGLSPRLRKRAEVQRFQVHPGELEYLLENPALVRSGASAAAAFNLDLVSGADIEGYVSSSDLEKLKADHALVPVGMNESANVLLRVVPDNAWFLTEPIASAVAIDLLEAPDTRSRKAGEELLSAIKESA